MCHCFVFCCVRLLRHAPAALSLPHVASPSLLFPRRNDTPLAAQPRVRSICDICFDDAVYRRLLRKDPASAGATAEAGGGESSGDAALEAMIGLRYNFTLFDAEDAAAVRGWRAGSVARGRRWGCPGNEFTRPPVQEGRALFHLLPASRVRVCFSPCSALALSLAALRAHR